MTLLSSQRVKEAAQTLAEDTIAFRRDFHAHPELAFEEVRTAGIVADTLTTLGLNVRTNVGKTGVVAVLDTGKPGKTVLARADMDALPVQEACEHSYRSTLDGKMHACGHDGHTAVLLSVARIMAEHKDTLNGKIVFVFQPAEEIVRGAQAMLADNALAGLSVDYSIGLHLSSMHSLGTVAMRAGPSMAAADSFAITIHGKGGHAALPHNTVDPIVIASQLILSLQTLVSRETNPVDQSVISITSVHGGTAFNIIPESVELKGTLRTFLADTRETLKNRIYDVTNALTTSMRASASIQWNDGSPAVINDPAMTERLKRVATNVVGESNVIQNDQMMGGDDMALWLQQAPGCYFFVGAANPEKGMDKPHHHPQFDIDEASLVTAVEVLSNGIIDFLS